MATPDANDLLLFESEAEPPPPAVPEPHADARPPYVWVGLGLCALAAVIVGSVLWARAESVGRAARTSPSITGASGAVGGTPSGVGTVHIESQPTGAVSVDGVALGTTPLDLSLAAGTHALAITAGDVSRTLPLTVAAGTTTRQFVEFASAAAASETGGLDVRSDPSGAQVVVDNTPRGATPLVLASIPVGVHRLAISSGGTTVHQTVTVTAGATATVVSTMGHAASAAGWLTIDAPLPLTVLENGQVIGTTSARRLMLPSGAHALELTNEACEFRTTLAVEIGAGKSVARTVEVPNGALSVNALPWAEVLVDGRDVGTTPLANLSVPVGTHEVLWRHPQFGERRRSVTVPVRTPARASMSFIP